MTDIDGSPWSCRGVVRVSAHVFARAVGDELGGKLSASSGRCNGDDPKKGMITSVLQEVGNLAYYFGCIQLEICSGE